MSDKAWEILITIGAVAIVYAISWAVTVGIIKLITICFGLSFSLAVATGIWLIMVLERIVFHTVVKKD